MKGLHLYLTPFAPDQSGASSVFYPLGGMIVILDAGGCTGNICGFDEPRWQEKKSAIFSAGLRDMDAIMGRDKLLVKKIHDQIEKIDARFVAIIGTPVPATIATDYAAIRKMLQNEIDIPVLTVDANGMDTYDSGAKKAYQKLFETFSKPPPSRVQCPQKGRVGVIGAIPLALSDKDSADKIKDALISEGYEKVCLYGIDESLGDVAEASMAEKNIAVSPCGVRAAGYLKETFGTPYEIRYPGACAFLDDMPKASETDHILICHQEVLGKSLKDAITKKYPAVHVDICGWFDGTDELNENYIYLKDEDDLINLAKTGKYSLFIGDEMTRRMVKAYIPSFFPLAEFAVSGI